MATTIEKFDSAGGFSVEKTIHIDELHNAKELNFLEIKNSQFTDSNTTTYILRGINTATLALDGVGSQVPIGSNTMNFITGHIIATDSNGVIFTSKLESAVYGDASGKFLLCLLWKLLLRMIFPQVKLGQLLP